MRPRLAVFAGLGIAVAVAVYLAALASGMVSAVAYASGSERQEGFSSTSWFPLRIGAPTVWLSAGSALQADFDVDATFGALSLTVAPPLVLRTPLQAATAYVAGKRAGSVLFVAQTPGWYTVRTDTTPIGGPRCPRERSMGEMLIGSSDCPTYDVSYRVVWRLAEPGRAAPATTRLNVPRPNEKLVTKYVRD